MAKGIIVVDIPKDCWSCDYVDSQWCALTSKNVPNGNAQKHCPIKPMPEKFENADPYERDLNSAYDCGWNACIDGIFSLSSLVPNWAFSAYWPISRYCHFLAMAIQIDIACIHLKYCRYCFTYHVHKG